MLVQNKIEWLWCCGKGSAVHQGWMVAALLSFRFIHARLSAQACTAGRANVPLTAGRL